MLHSKPTQPMRVDSTAINTNFTNGRVRRLSPVGITGGAKSSLRDNHSRLQRALSLKHNGVCGSVMFKFCRV
jgi:hypothetical protein